MEETPVKEAPSEVKPEAAPLVADTPVEAPPKEAPPEEAPPKKKRDKKLLILLLLLLLIGIGVVVYLLLKDPPDDGRVPYAEGAVLLGGGEVEPVEEGWINLRYHKKAFSSDGVNFTGLLANDAGNVLDMYFDVYADSDFEDQVFLSGLVQPGYGLQTFTLNHALPAGSTTCYVIHNQVETDEDGNQNIVRQMIITVEFVVN